jgi:hypothetical protein
MASGILGQSSPSATTNTTVYTVPAVTTAAFTVNICNRSGSPITARVAVASSGSPTDSEWIEYDASIPANGVLERTGIVAQAGERVVVYVSAATASVNVYGYEA